MKLRVRPAGALIVVAGLLACDFPTSIPRWETTWITPSQTTSVSVVELLPGGLGITPDTSAFVLGFDPVGESWTLGELCSLCPAATAPKPPFTVTVSAAMPLPADVRSIDVTGGDIDIVLTNGLSFDPIRPGTASDSGSITITVRSGAATVASLVIDGATQAFPPDSDLPVSLAFAASTIADDLEFEFIIDSPTGDVTTMSPSDSIGATIVSEGVLVSEATVAVPTTAIPGRTVELDLRGVAVAEDVTEGALFLEIENPLGVTGTLNLSFEPEGGTAIVKSIPLLAGSSDTEISFSQEEMSEMLGSNNTLSVSVSLPAGQEATIRPDMVISIGARLRATIILGGGSDDESEG